MTENPHIADLRRRAQLDPASIALAALAEEYRRAGQYKEALAVCSGGTCVLSGRRAQAPLSRG